ncbi:hypothetical protein DSCW_23570 [Desulfosarcina widdelii]|uniref:TIGR03545 family protein n=1 Tax=Desulfosarcina widdelii TaxID=947919 RepID=A0A5K7Z2S1_9BACT|nr:TIGR03545 family protein [Desulfosarcina widdelii]BBO74940.1 hypothetical protein DSCW_23570 [Desulfosarcina widdelii]
MKGWIRWKGLIAFVVAVVTIVLVWFLAVDAVVRRVIETAGTRVVGARVDLAAADLSLFPTGLTLVGLEVTNPDAPMENTVEVRKMTMDLDPGYLIRRKVIVNNLQVEGLAFNTPRKASGEVPELARKNREKKERQLSEAAKAGVEKVCGSFSMPSLSQPDVEAILAKESLDSIATAKELDQALKAEQAKWEKELERLADEKTLAEYKTRIEKIKGGGGSLGAILGAAGEVQQLQADIKKDLDRLKAAKKTFTTDFNDYQARVRNLANAPAKDIQRLTNKYSLSPEGLSNMSQLIFGQRLCGWVQTASDWYAKIEPYLSNVSVGGEGKPEEQTPLRGKGKNIRFAETPPMPDFLVRNLKIDAALPVGKLTGKAENVTLDQHILGRPMTFAFLGREMKRIASLNLSGTANYVKPDAPKNDAKLTVKGLGLENLSLIDDKVLPLVLRQATGNLNLNLETVGNVLDAALKANFSSVEFDAQAAGKAAMAEALQTALSGIDQFSLTADIAGTLQAYTVDISSDLDKVLKSAVGQLVKKEVAKFQAQLEQKISARLQGPMQQAQSSLSGLGDIETELTNRLNLGNNLLKGLKLPF